MLSDIFSKKCYPITLNIIPFIEQEYHSIWQQLEKQKKE